MEQIKRAIKHVHWLTKVFRFLYRIPLTLCWNMRFCINYLRREKTIYGCCFVFTTLLGNLRKNNWGDDLNDHLFTLISDKKINFVPFDQLFFCPSVKRYSLIGSIIGDFCLDNTIIYGSGAITANPVLVGKPEKVLSVRGPLTREVLMKNGIDCPQVYGDPAMLLPLVYKPKVEAVDKIGVIPHYRTGECEWIECLKKSHDVRIIDMSHYDRWTDIVDAIISCKLIISESLHGLIVAESYAVPSIWVEFVPHNCGWEWDFKFRDFYQSIGKYNQKCYSIYQGYSTEEILEYAKDWKPGKIDFDSMLKAFPFSINGDALNE